MKKITLSAVTALLVASSAFAVETKIDNVKVEGTAGLYYQTTDSGTNSMFDQPASAADAFVSLKVTADLNKKVKGGISAKTLSTLGLENNLVSATYSNSHPNTVDDFTVVTEAWLEIAAGKKTSVTLGRQQLDTPLVFSEKWGAISNTYEAAVVADKSIENLTLVGAYVGRGNGALTSGPLNASGAGNIVNAGGEFVTFGADSNTSSGNNAGAYALGAVYGSGDLTVQAWGYNVTNVADAMWVQLDQDPDAGLGFGAQYTTIAYKQTAHTTLDSDAMAAKVSFAKKDSFSVSAAYSATAKEGQAAYNVGGGVQSKLYTEAWWNYGYVTRADTTAINLTAEMPLSKTLEAGLYITQTGSSVTGTNQDMMEVTASLAKDYDGLKAMLVYIHTDAEDQNIVSGTTGDAYGTIQVYLDAEF